MSFSYWRTSSAASRAIFLSGIFTPEIAMVISSSCLASRRSQDMPSRSKHVFTLCRLGSRSGRHLLRGLWRISEADCHAIVRIHQADRDGEIDELALLEHGAGSLVSLIRDAGFGHAGHRFGPCEGGTLPLVEEMTAFRPGLHQRDLFDLLSALQQIAGVHVEAVGAAVDLRNAQIDQSDQ